MPISSLWTAGEVVGVLQSGFSLVAIALIVERTIFWWRIKNKQRCIVKQLSSLYGSDCFEAISKLERMAQLHIARIFPEALELEQPTLNEFRFVFQLKNAV